MYKSSALTKCTLGAVGSGVVACSGYGIYRMQGKDETLKSLLTNVPLASNLESYKTTFEFSKKTDTELMNMLKNKKNSISDKSNLEEVAPLIEGWCKENIDKKVGIPDQEEILKKIKKWCVAKPSTIEGMLKSTILSGGWNEKYNEVKETAFEEIKEGTDFNEKEDQGKGGPILQKWCEAKIKNKTYEVGASDLLKKVEDRCTATQN